MANYDKADLIMHPARTAILQTLSQAPMTTRELSELLPSIPQPSIYRHLKLLLEAGMVAISETRQVRGIQEKVYRLEKAPRLSAEDLAGLSKEEHLRYFTMYTAGLIQGFADYIRRSSDPYDPLGDRMGYTELAFYATPEELDEFIRVLQPALAQLAAQPPDEQRLRRKLAVISFPLLKKEE